MKRACFEDGPRFSGAKHTETGWADGVFLLHAGRKDFFDTLSLSAGAVDDLADLPLAETELSRKRPVVAAVESGTDVPVTGVAL